MAVFITAVTDPFTELRGGGARTVPPTVRRPFRGVQIKQDTYAVLRVTRADGTDISLFDSSAAPDYYNGGDENIGRSSNYANFIVQSFSDQRMEKQQIVQTFGEDYIFFFGEQPRFVNVTGVLINTKDFDWKNEFLENYERYLRGTRLVENNARLYFYVDDVVMEGYLVNSTVNLSADQPYLVQFSFQMFVCQYATLSNVGSIRYQQGAQNSADYINDEGSVLFPAPDPSLPSDVGGALAKKATTDAQSGGLNAFLAEAKKFANTADTTIQRILEEARNILYGPLVVSGIGAGVRPPQLTNQAAFRAPQVNQPIYRQTDEYVNPARTSHLLNELLDQEEINRLKSEIRTPEQLEAAARKQFAAAGIDTTGRSATYLLLGRGAFAAAQYMGTFGVRQADGEIGIASAAVTTIT